MKIRKDGKVVNLTESDLRRIVKRVISEQKEKDTDFDDAVKFCKEVEDWWEGSDNPISDPDHANDSTGTNYTDFFSKFQGFWDDRDSDASTAYGNMILTHLENTVASDNKYYAEIEDWLKDIIDQIDNVRQVPQFLPLKSTDGRWADFTVDPEIDVDFFATMFGANK